VKGYLTAHSAYDIALRNVRWGAWLEDPGDGRTRGSAPTWTEYDAEFKRTFACDQETSLSRPETGPFLSETARQKMLSSRRSLRLPGFGAKRDREVSSGSSERVLFEIAQPLCAC
jgi:hypothetical protein